ncbi:zinc finger SWIM domain-containing protein 7-like [Uloborus diversus]|uniref:zinc finger SWIM domain-containing protein 7-like n=1 Tax=Uloborus diversus TaxID=327109 RepID=UPI0024090754|nr:zinc finger SWIM domain-containing protein 7-like [Uloborus diversus]
MRAALGRRERQLFYLRLVSIGLILHQEIKVSESIVMKLLFLFDNTAIQALDLIDRHCIAHIQSPSGRELYRIQRNNNEFFICLKNSNFCTCPAFNFQVLRKRYILCKHMLAVMLCRAMGLCKELQYSDETVTLMLLGDSSTST